MDVVHPRYTCGSPAALFDNETAQRVAQEEIAAFVRITTWARGYDPDATWEADHRGVAGIVFSAISRARHWVVRDYITGWSGQIEYKSMQPGERLSAVIERLQGNVQESGISPDWDETVIKARR